ncbi:MAG TPA: hypothetical protein VM597_15155 [Gemmataceae bacterium]|jgi:hypothetical protein|nr:hypothetical protein [Gemmataceae bacterium]
MTDDDLLTPHEVPPPPGFREGLADRTARLVRTRARFRAAGRLVLPVVGFLAGLGVAWIQPTPGPRVEYVTVEVEVPIPVAVPPPSPPSPAELELRAEQLTVKAESARVYREAGDRYLREWADHRAALRCYRNFLDMAGPGDLAAAREDTWLLTSLKNARESENPQ